MLKKFTVKDIVFLAIISAALTIAGMLTMPLVMSITLFGVRNLAAAVVYPIFCVIALMKIRKPGALIIVGLFTGFVVLMMAPVMFFNNFIGTLLAEIVTLAIFKNYNSDKSVIVSAALFIPFTLPTSLVFAMLLHGKTFSDVVAKPEISIFMCIGTFIVSFLSANVGLKIAKELQKAGKLK